jgi:hypothetical protein
MYELRQDEIATAEHAWRYARIVYDSLAPALAAPGLHTTFEGDNLDRAGGLLSWRHAIGGSPLA